MRSVAATALLGAALAGCLGPGPVTRLAGGELRIGPPISPRAYEAFLAGAIAEERGDLPGAARSYRAALAAGPDDPEVLSRLGRVLCVARPHDADAAFERALELDPTLEGALARRAECLRARGRPADLSEALAVAPRRVELEARAVSLGAGVSWQRALALTAASDHAPVAWAALADYARAHRDAVTEVRALEALARVDAAGQTRGLVRAWELLDAGEVRLARELAGVALDARRRVGVDPAARTGRLTEARLRVACLLALDDAVARGDVALARRRALSTRLGLEEAAARALAMGEGATARALALDVAQADPSSPTAHAVLALTDPAGARLPQASAPLPAALAVELAERLERAGEREAAARFFAAVARVPVEPHDALLVPRVADLAARGVAALGDLPPPARVELAARSASSAGLDDLASTPLPAPYAYLRAALVAPGADATRALAARAAPTHPATVAADVLVAVAAGRADDAALASRAVDAGHGALALGARLTLARARRDAEGAALARRLLAGRASTAHEANLAAAP